MNNTLSKRLCLTAMLTLAAVVYTTSAFAETSKLVIESGDSAQSRQEAAMEKGFLHTYHQDEKIFIIILANTVIYTKNAKLRTSSLITGVHDENRNCNSRSGVS
ncbi:hypothetical protein NKG41_000647 [Salmonella enterica]|nr:hypothetical protein [Salmonella enterica]EJJ9846652.1 hypothetical protein [Salmonella enterica]